MVSRIVFAVLLLVTWRTDVYAVHTVSSCGQLCTSGDGQCNLGQDLSCATNPAITLSGGADLDLKGYKITCSACSASADAVLVTGSSSTIEDTGKADGTRGAIEGAWGTGINCQLNSSSWARNILVTGSGTGIAGCRKVSGVTVSNTTTYGVTNTSIGSTDYIKNSMIVGGSVGILLGGTGAGLVDHNVIANMSTADISTTATSSSLTISSNSLYAPPFTEAQPTLISRGTTTPITSGNVCGSTGVSSCGTCVTNGDCEAAETIFVGP